MDLVGPIRDCKQIEAMTRVLERNPRDSCLFVVGINCSLSANDLLALKIQDVIDEHGHLRDVIEMGPKGHVPLSGSAKEAIKHYLSVRLSFGRDEPLFVSRKTGSALQRSQAWKIVHDAARIVGITEPVGLNTLRKTYGYHALLNGCSVASLQRQFRHESAAVTLAYLGIYNYPPDEAYDETVKL